ncbi:hypothetical protein BU24DRAFT_99386 [Aaosphaeria arxii CBS 175.79]|uniref:Uncharacterized protein n=1 Tax=Aaosphaeria arxii CBS 175.79 TaxID=1450172 RepID=A0A6A5Y157_9PLEO|nr:uncharacterized protein BU24DRAFT_99386 [Aaosphaeria arxii CBS 175.79]KAF2018540.1 hypothetical protein BU24DRAFT_99386 [Aaosphaeria arxii CBS 175.79]
MRLFNPNFIVASGIWTSVVTLALPANVHNVSLTGDGHRRLQARGFLPPPSSDEEWAKYLCKGEKLLTMMNSDDRTAGRMLEPPQGSAASQFTNFPGEFDKWFYQPFNDDQTDLGEYYYGLSDALKDMGISRRRDDWSFLRATHGDRRPGAPNLNDQTYVVNGHTYRVRMISLL